MNEKAKTQKDQVTWQRLYIWCHSQDQRPNFIITCPVHILLGQTIFLAMFWLNGNKIRKKLNEEAFHDPAIIRKKPNTAVSSLTQQKRLQEIQNETQHKPINN